MERKSYFDATLWQDRLENDEAYCLSEDHGVVSAKELDFRKNILGAVSSCFLIKTSGSSGASKWVLHSKKALFKHAVLVNKHLGVVKDDVFGLVLPAYHVGGLGVVVRAHVSGAQLVSMNNKWSARCCVDFLVDHQVTILSLVPTQLVDIVVEEITCPKYVRMIVVGGGSIDSEVKNAAVLLGWPIKESYGMTETGSQIATGDFSENGYLSLIDGWQVRLNSENILEVKGDCLFKGYLIRNKKELEFVDPKINGWFTTNDLAGLSDRDGEIGIKFLSRNDQRVKILGELVDISVLESSLTEMFGREVCIIPFPDHRRGMKLFPVVDRISLVDLITDLSWSGLHRLEEPLHVKSFPRNTMGKLQRVKLVEAVESIVFSAD